MRAVMHRELFGYQIASTRTIPVGKWPSTDVILAALALGNQRLARETDREELPDTEVQRFLRDTHACVPARAAVGACEDLTRLRKLYDYYGCWFDDDLDTEWLEENGGPPTFEQLEEFFEAWRENNDLTAWGFFCNNEV